MISSPEEKSLPQKISEDIISFILEEKLQPGDKLPNETVLSERLNAGRSSIREAMNSWLPEISLRSARAPVPILLHPGGSAGPTGIHFYRR